MNRLRLPFLDLRHAAPGADADVKAAVARVLERGWYLLGEELTAFEAEFAQWLGVQHVVGVASGTDALMLTLRALGIGPGDEVITAANTCVPTVAAIQAAGATPVLADVQADTLTLDPKAVVRAITPHTRALMPVHLYGIPCDMDALGAIARAHQLELIEDAAQAHGSRWRDQPCGTLGRAAAFSFYPTKNLGALGDAGAVATNDEDLAATLRLLRSHGDTGGFNHTHRATNSRMDEIQAAALRAKLPHLATWNARRRDFAAAYRVELAGLPLTLPTIPADATWNAHLFPVRSEQRDTLQSHLRAAGVGTMIHYPRPVHLQPAYTDLGEAGAYPIAEATTPQLLSLPLHPGMSAADQAHVLRTVARLYGNM